AHLFPASLRPPTEWGSRHLLGLATGTCGLASAPPLRRWSDRNTLRGWWIALPFAFSFTLGLAAGGVAPQLINYGGFVLAPAWAVQMALRNIWARGVQNA